VYYFIHRSFPYHWWHSSNSSVCPIICNNCISVFCNPGLLSCKLRSNNTSSVCGTETDYYTFIRVHMYSIENSITGIPMLKEYHFVIPHQILQNMYLSFLNFLTSWSSHFCHFFRVSRLYRLICLITSLISRPNVWNKHCRPTNVS